MANYTHLSSLNVQGAVETSTQGKLVGSFDTMPAATALNSGQIVLYTGPTDTYIQGKYYVSNGTSWVLSAASPITTVDSELSDISTNPVQNKVIKAELDSKVPASGSYDADTSTITFKAASGAQLFQVTGIGNGGVQFTLELNYTGASDLSGISVTATPTSGATATVQGITNSNGKAFLAVKQGATYTIRSSKDEYEFPSAPSVTCTDLVTVVTIVCPSLPYNYATVDISLSDSNPATRCSYPQTITVNGVTVNNSCYGFTPASGADGNFAMNSWEGHKILEGIKPMSKNGDTWKDLDTDATKWAANASSEDYFTEFPFQWLSITNDGSRIRVIFSDKDAQPDSTFQCYAHAKGCDSYTNDQIIAAVPSASRKAIMASNNNPYFANTFHIGCFGASGGDSGAAIYSKKATTYATNIPYAYFWQGANARGTDYDGFSAQQLIYVQALFLLLYRSTDSQTAHSRGLADDRTDKSNAALSTTAYGMAGSSSSARNAFFWIHDAWGNIHQFIGGMWNRAGSSSKLYFWLPRQANSRAFDNGWSAASSSYATQSSLGTDTGLTCSISSGYISTVAGNNVGGFFPTAPKGSATTYWPDRGYIKYISSNAYFPAVGGCFDSADGAGLFYCYVNICSVNSYTACGARLSYRGGRALA